MAELRPIRIFISLLVRPTVYVVRTRIINVHLDTNMQTNSQFLCKITGQELYLVKKRDTVCMPRLSVRRSLSIVVLAI